MTKKKDIFDMNWEDLPDIGNRYPYIRLFPECEHEDFDDVARGDCCGVLFEDTF